MRPRHHHEHDLVQRFQFADAVDHQRVDDVPAAFRFGYDARQRLFGHAGIVFQRHAGDRIAFVHVAHQADETGDGAYLRIGAAERGNFSADIEIRLLHPHGHVSPRSPAEKRRFRHPA